MRFVKCVLPAVCLLGYTINGFAEKSQTVECPSARVIKQQKISQVIGYLPGLYMGMEESNYQTSAAWRFNLGPIMADSAKQVLIKSNEELKNISGPISQVSSDGTPLCVYKTKNPGNTAIATLIQDE